MPDPKHPTAADLAAQARALQSPPPPRVMGVPIPPQKPPPVTTTELGRAVQRAFDPRSAPAHEGTIPSFPAPPAPGSVAPKRSISPPPVELAPDPQSVREARRHARERAAESERQAPAPAVTDSIKIELPAGLRGGLGALGKALLGALAAALVGGGGAVVGSQTTSLPPAVAECPAQLEQLRAETRQIRDRVGLAERDVDELRAERRRDARKTEDVIGDVERLKKAVPRIEGVKPD